MLNLFIVVLHNGYSDIKAREVSKNTTSQLLNSEEHTKSHRNFEQKPVNEYNSKSNHHFLYNSKELHNHVPL
jgi:hypothetical protein